MDVDVKFMGSQVNLSTLPGVQSVSFSGLIKDNLWLF